MIVDDSNHPNNSLLAPHLRGKLLQDIGQLARVAGEAIMEVYASEIVQHEKADRSPVTLADERAEQLIVPALEKLTPGIPIVAEERVAAQGLPPIGRCFWLVDPLDGTKEFIKRNGEFTVNIALVEDGVPTLGVVYAPALGPNGQLYSGAAGLGATLEDHHGTRRVRCRAVPTLGATVVASRSHGAEQAEMDAVLAPYKVHETVSAGSSLKLCLVASGQADLYPRLGPTMEWDIAAGHAVLTAAGGHVLLAADAAPLRYGKPDLRNPPFLASGLA